MGRKTISDMRKAKLSSKARRDADVSNYVSRLQKKERRILYIDIGLVVVAIFAAASTLHSSISGGIKGAALIIALFTAGKTLWAYWKIRVMQKSLAKSAEGELIVKRTLPVSGGEEIDIAVLEPDETDNSLGFRAITYGDELVFSSDAIDQLIRNQEVTLCEDTRKKARVDEYIERCKVDLIEVLHLKKIMSERGNTEFFDDAKFCLSRNMSISDKCAFFHRGSYFDTFLTNELSLSVLEMEGRPAVDFRSAFPVSRTDDGKIVLSTLALSGMDDHVGISTLALSRDGFLIMWQQSRRAEQSQLLRVPSGSGSSDYSDLRGNSLNLTIAYGMQREVTEETLLKEKGFKPEDIGSTRLLGFFRWVRRGGKPEFVGITRLNLDADELWPDWTELEISPGKHFRVSCKTPSELTQALDRIMSWPEMSVPLIHIIHCIKNVLDSDPSYITNFWFGDADGV